MKQNKPTIIGLTGGIATGKSTVTKILKDKGFKVIDADLIARQILKVDKRAYREVVDYFGEEILNKDRTINRKQLGTRIFKDKKLREKLNLITHPYIIKEIKNKIRNSKDEVLFLDIPLLIEIYDNLKNNNIYIDKIWLIYCDRDTQIKRLINRDNIDYNMACEKINAQIDIDEKKKFADKIIDNTGSKLKLVENVESLLKEIS